MTPEARSSSADTDVIVTATLADPICRAVLDRMGALSLPDWWLTAGAVFQNVWNAVEGRPPGYGIKDYDVFYFDDTDLSWEAEDAVITAAGEMFADLDAPVELRNQARVHLWYEQKFGTPCAPFESARHAIDSFASTTCSVGVTRRRRWDTMADGLAVYAPYGTADIVGMRLHPNRRLAPREVYETKAAQYWERWPSLTVEPW